MTENVSTPSEPDGAPGDLERLMRFVNTLDVESGEDEIGTASALAGWLRGAGLPAGKIASDDVPRAHEVREALRKLMLANNGELLDPGAVARLKAAGRRATLAIDFDDHGHTSLEPACGGVDAAIGELLSIVAHSQAEGTWHRVKACLADPCQWAFYDHSRNRSRTWCSMEVCGNRAKARAYRERKGA